MTHTPPAASPRFNVRPYAPAIIPVGRFRTPPGVTLVRRRDDEPELMPVLVCATCNRPMQHIRAFVGQACRCRTCGTERTW